MTAAVHGGVRAMDDDGKGGHGNVRTALILLSISVAFFVGIVLKFWLFG